MNNINCTLSTTLEEENYEVLVPEAGPEKEDQEQRREEGGVVVVSAAECKMGPRGITVTYNIDDAEHKLIESSWTNIASMVMVGDFDSPADRLEKNVLNFFITGGDLVGRGREGCVVHKQPGRVLNAAIVAVERRARELKAARGGGGAEPAGGGGAGVGGWVALEFLSEERKVEAAAAAREWCMWDADPNAYYQARAVDRSHRRQKRDAATKQARQFHLQQKQKIKDVREQRRLAKARLKLPQIRPDLFGFEALKRGGAVPVGSAPWRGTRVCVAIVPMQRRRTRRRSENSGAGSRRKIAYYPTARHHADG